MTVETRDRIVAAGHELFTRHGFGQVGLDQVVQQASLTKTTFYNHFESKEQLIREVLDLQEAELRDQLTQSVQRIAGDDHRARLLAAFDVLGELLASPMCGCRMLLCAAAEYPNEHDPIHQAVVRNKAALFDLLKFWCQNAGAPDPEALASQLSQLLHGAVLNRMLDSDRRAGAENARAAAELVIEAAFGS